MRKTGNTMKKYWLLLIIMLILLATFQSEDTHSQFNDIYLNEENVPPLYCDRVPKLCFSAQRGSECFSLCESAIHFCCDHPIDTPFTPTDMQNCYNSIFAVQQAGCV